MLSCRLTSGPLWLGIYLFLWWFLVVIFGLFLLHWRYELPCQDKLPEFHSTPILGCIRVLWLVFHPLGSGLEKALFGWNSVTPLCLGIEVICVSQKNRGSVVAKYLLTPNVIFTLGVSTSKMIIERCNFSQFVTEGFWIFHVYG